MRWDKEIENDDLEWASALVPPTPPIWGVLWRDREIDRRMDG